MTTNSPEKPSSPGKSDPICIHSTPNSLPHTEWPGTPPSSGRRPTAQELIATEEKIAELWNDGQLPFLTHLDASSDGSLEQFLCDFFHSNIKPTDFVLGSHRSHLIYQLHGGADLIEQVKRGRSMFLHQKSPFFLSSAIVAGVASIAVGVALAIHRRGGSERVFVFCGDACTEHGHWLESVFYAYTKALPIVWVVLDNDSSCGVTKQERRGHTAGIATPFPELVTRFRYPMKWPHAGTGQPMTLKKTAP